MAGRCELCRDKYVARHPVEWPTIGTVMICGACFAARFGHHPHTPAGREAVSLLTAPRVEHTEDRSVYAQATGHHSLTA